MTIFLTTTMPSLVLLLHVLVGLSVAPVLGNGDDTIPIESFENPVHIWKTVNDPVMGGESTGNFTIENGLGKFVGNVVNVPFLAAPGFIQVKTNSGKFPDVSSCRALELVLRSSTQYEGYRVSFGNAHVPGGRFAFGYKANLHFNAGSSFNTVIIPFTNFTDKWDDATGDAIVTCQENKRYCPDQKTLQNFKTLALWGEGVAGSVNLEVQSISATQCGGEPTLYGSSRLAQTTLFSWSAPILVLVLLVGLVVAAVVTGGVVLIQKRRRSFVYSDIGGVKNAVPGTAPNAV